MTNPLIRYTFKFLIKYLIEGLTLRSQVVTIYTTIFNTETQTQSANTLGVWFLEQKATVSLYSNHWFVFPTAINGVWCDVRIESVYKNITFSLSLCHNPPPALRPRPPAPFRFVWQHLNHCATAVPLPVQYFTKFCTIISNFAYQIQTLFGQHHWHPWR